MIRGGLASRYSFDMLGEGARTNADAERYQASYLNAINAVGEGSGGAGPDASSGVSVKALGVPSAKIDFVSLPAAIFSRS